jgi:hypothetical protein
MYDLTLRVFEVTRHFSQEYKFTPGLVETEDRTFSCLFVLLCGLNFLKVKLPLHSGG